MPKICASCKIFSRSGMDCAPSHLETDCRVTFSFSASSSATSRFFFEAGRPYPQKSYHCTSLFCCRGLVRSGVLPAYPAGRLRATNRRRAMCQPVVAQAGGPWENGVFRCAARCGGHPGGTCPAGRGTAAPVLREPRPRCRSRPASAAEGTETGGLRQADRQK